MCKKLRLQKEFKALLILIILSFTIRFVFFVFFNPFVGFNDGADYASLARNIFRGEGFKRDNILPLYDKVPIHSEDHLRPPLFPFLIAAIFFLVGPDDIALKLISLLFGTFLVLPSYFLGKKLFNKNVGIACAFFVTLDPFLIEYSTHALTEIMSAFLITLAVYYMLLGLDEKSITKSGVSGLLVGLAYLTRYNNVVFIIIFAIWALVYTKKLKVYREKYFWLFFLSFFATILPWLIRNFLIFGNPFYSSHTHVLIFSSYQRLGITYDMIYYNPNQAPIPLLKLFAMNPSLVIIGWLTGAKNLYFMAGQSLGPIKSFLILFGGISIHKYKFQRNFILYFIPICFFCIFALFPDWRFIVPILPALYVLGGNGIIELKSLIMSLFPSNNSSNKFFRFILSPNKIILIFLVILLIFDFGRLSSAALHAQKRMQATQKYKIAGTWIKTNTPTDAIIMARKVIIGWYSDRPVVPPPIGDYNELLEIARHYNVSYLLISDVFVQLRPNLGYLMDLDKAPDNLRLVYSDLEGYRIVIYEIVS